MNPNYLSCKLCEDEKAFVKSTLMVEHDEPQPPLVTLWQISELTESGDLLWKAREFGILLANDYRVLVWQVALQSESNATLDFDTDLVHSLSALEDNETNPTHGSLDARRR